MIRRIVWSVGLALAHAIPLGILLALGLWAIRDVDPGLVGVVAIWAVGWAVLAIESVLAIADGWRRIWGMDTRWAKGNAIDNSVGRITSDRSGTAPSAASPEEIPDPPHSA